MKDEIIHSYPMYVADWVRSETRIKLSSAGRGMFRELLDYCWIEGSLPNDVRALRSISGGTDKEFALEWPIMERCFDVMGDRLHHWKVDEKRPELVAHKQQRSIAGRASVEARRQRKLNERSTSVQTDTTVSLKPSLSVSVSTSVSGNSPTPLSLPGKWTEMLCDMHPGVCDPRFPSTFCEDNWHRLREDPTRYEEFMQGVYRGLLAWTAYWQLEGGRFAQSLDKWLSGQGWKKAPPKPKPILDGPMYDDGRPL